MQLAITEEEIVPFLSDYSIELMEQLCSTVRSVAIESGRPPISTHAEFTGYLHGILTTQRPQSIVRLADGEGNILMMRAPGPHLPLLQKSRRIHLMTEWGISANDLEEHQLDWFTDALREAVLAGDVVGIPTATRMTHWRNRFARGEVDFRGYVGDLETLAFARSSIDLRNATISDCMLHVWLLPVMKLICKERKFIGLVTRHTSLQEGFAEHFGVADVQLHPIPAPANLAIESLSASEYMERFRRALAEMRVPYEGALFLVGAGFVGKIVCARIKELGGIAIDVGSSMDVWAGEKTRRWHESPELAGYQLVQKK